MKKLLVGCLVIIVLGAVALGVGSYFLFRAASPYIENARASLRELSELSEIDKGVANTASYSPPASGELTEAQVQRFTRVQAHVRSALGQRMKEFEEKYQHLKSDANGRVEPSFTELMSGLRDLAGVFLEARRYQVDALNTEQFSKEEYSWVRARVFEAAGVEVASMIDFSALERAVREGTGNADFSAPRLPAANIPEKNRALIKPHLKAVETWLPLPAFGL